MRQTESLIMSVWVRGERNWTKEELTKCKPGRRGRVGGGMVQCIK